MSVADEIEAKLRTAFAPTQLQVVDDSDRHYGHAGWREGGNTHFTVTIASPKLDGLSRVEQHRAVNAVLTEEFDKGLHALAIKVKPSSS